MTNIELRYMETVAANLPRIAKALERIADAVGETAARMQVVNDPTVWFRGAPPVTTGDKAAEGSC